MGPRGTGEVYGQARLGVGSGVFTPQLGSPCFYGLRCPSCIPHVAVNLISMVWPEMQLHLPPAGSLGLCDFLPLSNCVSRKDPSRRHSWDEGGAAFSLRLFNDLFNCSPERRLPASPLR